MSRIFVALMAVWLGLQGTVYAASSEFRVSGVVRDSRNSNCVELATIILMFEGSVKRITHSQRNGDYSISFYEDCEIAENCKIVVSKKGFSTTCAIINISFDTKKDLELFIIPEKCSNDEIKSKVVQLADSIINTDGAMTGLALLRAYKLTRKMGKDGTFITEGHSNYLQKADIIAQDIIENLNNGQTYLSSTELTFLYYLSNSTFFKSATERQVIFAEGKNALEKMIGRGAFVYERSQMANWVEVFRLYGDKLSKETQEDLHVIGERFVSYADTFVDHLMERYTTTKDGRCGVFFIDGYYGDYIDIALHAKVTEVLKRFYNNSTYQERVKASVAFLNTIQSNGYFYGKGIPLDVNFGNSDNMINNMFEMDNIFEMLSIHDQACAIMAQAVNCQTTWTNYDKKIGTYWGANALVVMLDSGKCNDRSHSTVILNAPVIDVMLDSGKCNDRSQDAAEIISALYYSCREGDVDRSGKIIGYDASLVSKASVKKVLLNGPALLAADFDGDDKINSFDAQCILKLSVGKEPPVPVSP